MYCFDSDVAIETIEKYCNECVNAFLHLSATPQLVAVLYSSIFKLDFKTISLLDVRNLNVLSILMTL